MLSNKKGEVQILSKSSVNKCPKKGQESTKPTTSQTLVKAADNSAGKYLTQGLYKKGRTTIEKNIKNPIISWKDVISIGPQK